MAIKEIIKIDKSDRKLYKKLKEETIFQNKHNKDLFLLAISYGYKNRKKKKLEKSDNTFLRTSYLSDEDWSFLKSLAISVTTLDVLKDINKVLDIAEQYAHSGIKLLTEEISSFQIGKYTKKMENDVIRFIKYELLDD